jgi:hypothetical protein
VTALDPIDRLAVDPFHTGEALKDYVATAAIELDYVPGITQVGYLHELLTNALGEQWLHGGRLSVRFIAPLYNGEQVRVDGRVVSQEPGGGLEYEVWIEKQDGTRVTIATARCPGELAAI